MVLQLLFIHLIKSSRYDEGYIRYEQELIRSGQATYFEDNMEDLYAKYCEKVKKEQQESKKQLEIQQRERIKNIGNPNRILFGRGPNQKIVSYIAPETRAKDLYGIFVEDQKFRRSNLEILQNLSENFAGVFERWESIEETDSEDETQTGLSYNDYEEMRRKHKYHDECGNLLPQYAALSNNSGDGVSIDFDALQI